MPPDHGPAHPAFDPEPWSDGDDQGASPDPAVDIWSWLPRLPARQVRLGRSVANWSDAPGWKAWLGWLQSRLRRELRLGDPEVLGRPSGLGRPGLVAQFRIPGWSTRLAVGLEVPLAHAVVDGLLDHDRLLAESRLQLTPVEWGTWSYLAILALSFLDEHRRGGPAVLLDRVGPDPFDPADLGEIVTVRWPVQVGGTAGTARLWISESALALLAVAEPSAAAPAARSMPAAAEFASAWLAEAGSVDMPQGLKRLRAGGVLPLDSQLVGTPQSPLGPIALICTLSGDGGRFVIPAEPVEGSAGRLVRVTGPTRHEPTPRVPLTLGVNTIMTPNPDSPADLAPTDIPVTLTVELGRLNLSLGRLADLKSGDVLELGRHSREPVELTSGGRLVARGELILIDTELGVRVTQVYL